jgi:putative hydrolase of the HAD superfamily
MNNLKVICFDADDTLWVNEPYYREIERQFARLLTDFSDEKTCNDILLQTEINNLKLYGYGAKSFVLSMIETALRISNQQIDNGIIEKILALGRDLINKPLQLLQGVEEVLTYFHGKYRLIMATKGDLLDQERKLKKSGLENYFHHIEIMSEKDTANYKKLIAHQDVKADEFVMIGNSVKSDILPVINIGAYAIHVPCDTTWAHEHAENSEIENPRFRETDKLIKIKEIIPAFE